MEGKVHIGNKWWKILTIYSKEMKTSRRRVENAMKENRQDCILLGGDFNGRTGERGAKIGKKNLKTRWKMQGEETDGVERRKWMGGIEREQTRGPTRGMDLYR
jgi:hypothetical protein